MVDPFALRQLPLSLVQKYCAQESEYFAKKQPSDPRYCYELFRRALQEQNEEAWAGIYQQYQRMVMAWIQQSPYFAQTNEPIDVIVNNAFYNMWHAFTQKAADDDRRRVHNPDKFAQFPALPALLKFLWMCTRSAVKETITLEVPLLTTNGITAPDPYTQAEQVDLESLWHIVNTCLQSDKERIAVYNRMFMTPREIYDRYKDMFKSVSDVYRTLENAKDRLRRCQELKDFLA